MNIESGAARTVAVVGLGNVAESHLLAYKQLSDLQVIAVVEPRAERLAEVCKRYNLRGFSTVESMLAARLPDIACILTPAQTHRRLTEICAAAGVHVLCEKPMAVTLEDATDMDAACKAAGVQFLYGSSYRFLPAVVAAKQIIQAGEIGSVRLIVEQVVGGEGSEAYRALSATHYPTGGPGGGGYGLVDHGIHMLDVFPWMCDSRITAVFGRGDRTGAVARPEFALLTMANGALGVLLYDSSTWSAELPSEGAFNEGRQWIDGHGWIGEVGTWQQAPGHIRVYGTHGSLRILHYANKLFVNRKGQLAEQAVPPGSAPYHFGEQMRQFCVSLDQLTSPSASAQDGIRALHALLGIYESEGNGRWRSVDDDTPTRGHQIPGER